MKRVGIITLTLLLLTGFNQKNKLRPDDDILSYIVDPTTQELHFYWKDAEGRNYTSFKRLKTSLEKQHKELVFAMNGGMYRKDLSPQGLYIEEGVNKNKIDTMKNGYGNFYMQPNGVFYLTEGGKAVVCTSDGFHDDGTIRYATQSGPMLVINGDIHSTFINGSTNVHIRNGVGILPDGRILFALSKKKINFYDFATFFKQQGCKNALYLDGFVSRAYLPSKDWIQLDGNFGVIIGEIKSVKN